MPGHDGRLTDQEIAHIRTTLPSKRDAGMSPAHRCPYCGHDDWTMGRHLVADQILAGSIMGPVVPYVVFFCTRCAYTMRFNAVMLGLFPATSVNPRVIETAPPSGGTHGA